ncbi:hypothetical protein [Nocardia fluminea]
MTTTVSMAYVRECRAMAGEHRSAIDTFTHALLDGRATTAMARSCGLPITDRYHLPALSIPATSTTVDDSVDHRVASRRVIARIRSGLVGNGGRAVLSVLNNCGGTILIPTPALHPDQLEPLAEAADAVVTAVHREVAVDSIPEMVHTLHDMVDVADRLAEVVSAPPKTRLYEFDQLAAEYQLTRPGTVRESLARRLDPLMDHPLLLTTLTVFLLSDQNRQRAAREHHRSSAQTHRGCHRTRRCSRRRSMGTACRAGRAHIPTAAQSDHRDWRCRRTQPPPHCNALVSVAFRWRVE